MGAFIVNLHVRVEDRDGVVVAMRELANNCSWVTAPKDGWVSVYEEQASGQDGDWIRHMGAELSSRLNTSAAAFLVHDSDFLCYWVFDRGEIVDEFNSCPDYFDDDDGPGTGRTATAQGQPEVLLRYCKPGSRIRDVEQVLQAESVFAEQQLRKLARLLGIDADRAGADYRDLGQKTAEEFEAEFAGDAPPRKSRSIRRGAPRKAPQNAAFSEDEDNDDREGLPPQLAQLLGLVGGTEADDPLVVQLVQAASDGNVQEIERLVSAGGNLQGTAPMKLAMTGQETLATRLLAGRSMGFPVTPLLAAISHKRVDAARRLIELGADLHAQHPLFGQPLHNAVSAGSAEIVRLLLDAGADINARNTRGQTPLQSLQTVRGTMAQVEAMRATMHGPMFQQIQAQFGQLIPVAGWDECEQLLRERGGI
jgi:hypothetical protein